MTTGVDIIGTLLRADADLLQVVPPERIKAGALPDGAPLPALLIRCVSSVGGSFASLMGRFNAATSAARAGDQDAAKSLPGLSQALLQAAGQAATSRQELDRVQGQIAASLEATHAALARFMGGTAGTSQASYTDAILAAAAATQAASAPPPANDDMASELRALRDELALLRSENNAGHATNAANTGSIKRTLDNVTQQSGGDAISTVNAA